MAAPVLRRSPSPRPSSGAPPGESCAWRPLTAPCPFMLHCIVLSAEPSDDAHTPSDILFPSALISVTCSSNILRDTDTHICLRAAPGAPSRNTTDASLNSTTSIIRLLLPDLSHTYLPRKTVTPTAVSHRIETFAPLAESMSASRRRSSVDYKYLPNRFSPDNPDVCRTNHHLHHCGSHRRCITRIKPPCWSVCLKPSTYSRSQARNALHLLSHTLRELSPRTSVFGVVESSCVVHIIVSSAKVDT
jgi:hypothetical protein